MIGLQQDHESFNKLELRKWSGQYIDAVIARGWYLYWWSAMRRILLRKAIFYSPPLRHLWRDGRFSNYAPRLTIKQEHKNDLLANLLIMLTMNNPEIAIPMYPVADQIERLLAAVPAQRARITPHVQYMLSRSMKKSIDNSTNTALGSTSNSVPNGVQGRPKASSRNQHHYSMRSLP